MNPSAEHALSLLYTPPMPGDVMARSDSFFIRAQLNLDDTSTFTPTNIDLGSFVDALGKTVMRIHNVSAQYFYGGNSDGRPILAAANTSGMTQWQLTTQNQSGIVLLDNRTLIASGSLVSTNSGTPGVANEFSFATQDLDIAPQHWTNGYLVAVESLQFAGVNATEFSDNCFVSIVLECTVETMTSAAAMALALSQQ